MYTVAARCCCWLHALMRFEHARAPNQKRPHPAGCTTCAALVFPPDVLHSPQAAAASGEPPFSSLRYMLISHTRLR